MDNLDAHTTQVNDRRPFTPEEFLDRGILWAINRYIFHPRGMALALSFDHDITTKITDKSVITGWEIQVDADGEPWGFEKSMDVERFRDFESFLDQVQATRDIHTVFSSGDLSIPGGLGKLREDFAAADGFPQADDLPEFE